MTHQMLPGLTGRRQRSVIDMPASGTWTARVTNVIGPAGAPPTSTNTQITGSGQNYFGIVQRDQRTLPGAF